MFCMCMEGALLFRGVCPYRDLQYSSQDGWEDEVSAGHAINLPGKKEGTEVAVLASTEVALDGR